MLKVADSNDEMYDSINANTTRQIADLILTLKAKDNLQKEQAFILAVAQRVLSNRLEKLGASI